MESTFCDLQSRLLYIPGIQWRRTRTSLNSHFWTFFHLNSKYSNSPELPCHVILKSRATHYEQYSSWWTRHWAGGKTSLHWWVDNNNNDNSSNNNGNNNNNRPVHLQMIVMCLLVWQWHSSLFIDLGPWSSGLSLLMILFHLRPLRIISLPLPHLPLIFSDITAQYNERNIFMKTHSTKQKILTITFLLVYFSYLYIHIFLII